MARRNSTRRTSRRAAPELIPASWAAAAERMTLSDLSTELTLEGTEYFSYFALNLWANEVRAEGRTERASNLYTVYRAAAYAFDFLRFNASSDQEGTARVRTAWEEAAPALVSYLGNPDGNQWEAALPFLSLLASLETVHFLSI